MNINMSDHVFGVSRCIQKDKSTCYFCQQKDKLKKRRFTPILPGWPFGSIETSHIYAHTECYQIWYKEIYYEYAILDQSLNECKHFVRNHVYDGNWVKDDLILPCKSWWNGDNFWSQYKNILLSKGYDRYNWYEIR